MTDPHARVRDANPLTESDLSEDDPDLSLAAVWSAIERQDVPSATARSGRQRRRVRRKLVRSGAISLAALAALSGTALAAGDALGIINLGGGATAAQVTIVPVWNGTTGTFDSGTANGQYIYELAGVGASGVVCGPANPDVATFITSTKPLTQSDLQGLLDPSNPTGLNIPDAEGNALGITGDGGGCFPASVAGPLATPQTPAQQAAGEALTAQITSELKAGVLEHGRGINVRSVTVTRDGKRVMVKLSRLHGHRLALALAIAESAKTK